MNAAHVDVIADGDRVWIGLTGDVDLANAADIQEQLTAAVPNDAAAVEVDLARVTYLDSAGLQVLFVLTTRLQRLQIALRLVAPPDSPAHHALRVAGMESLTPLEPDGTRGRGGSQTSSNTTISPE